MHASSRSHFARWWSAVKSVASRLIDDTLTVALSEVANAIRLLAEGNKVVAEGAGAIAVAAACSNRHRFSNVCAVVSGGNLDAALLAKILRGEDVMKVGQ